MKRRRKLFNYDERREILKKTDFRCAHCGKKLDEETMTVEHIFPFSKGGDHSEYNTTALCNKCNTEKSNFTYEVEAYYKYIMPEYIEKYRKKFSRLKLDLIDSENLLGFTDKIYKIHPVEMYQMIYSANKRNKQKAAQLFEQMAVKLKLERAYEARAEDIVNFLKKCESKYGSDIGIYDNEYIIMDHMKKGRAFILTNSMDEIYGVYIFIPVKYIYTDFPQINNFCENTGFQKVYVMTLAITSEKAWECREDIMRDFLLTFIGRKCMPLFFNILGRENNDIDCEIISFHTELERYTGDLQFMSAKGIREYLLNLFEYSVKAGAYTEEQVEQIISETLNKDVIFHNDFILIQG